MFGRKKKEKSSAPKEKRFKTIRDAYALAKREYRFVFVRCLLIFAAILIGGILLGSTLDREGYAAFVTLPLAFLAAFFYFTRLASSAAYANLEGKLGAAASVLMSIRRGWTITPHVNFNKNQDMVHQAVGRPGVVLVGEGGPAVKALLNDQRKKIERYAPGVPVFEFVAGMGEGQISIRKIQRHLKKYPKKLSRVQVRELRARLKSISSMTIPLPKGPLPKNVGMPKLR